jgi:hypothetical protein
MPACEITLDDSDVIEDISQLDPGSFEPLYWALEDSIYKSELPLARMIYRDFLYLAKHRKQVLTNALQSAYITRLQEIAFELYDEKSFKARKPIAIKQASYCKKLPFDKESDLRDYLAVNSDVLSDALEEDVRVVDTEVRTDCDYRCDILASSERVYYPIELKLGQANHAVVSQITKYCYFFYRKFRYGWHKPIQGVVVAAGFDAWSINELRREGIWIFDIFPNRDGVKLIRIP